MYQPIAFRVPADWDFGSAWAFEFADFNDPRTGSPSAEVYCPGYRCVNGRTETFEASGTVHSDASARSILTQANELPLLVCDYSADEGVSGAPMLAGYPPYADRPRLLGIHHGSIDQRTMAYGWRSEAIRSVLLHGKRAT